MDADGNIVVAGTFYGTADLGAGVLDGAQGTALLLAKFKPDGSLAWNRAFSHAKDASLWPSLAITSDGTSFVGGTADTWPLDLGTGPLNTSAHPAVAFLARFAP